MKFKLSEILTLIGGGTPKTTNASYWGGAIPWLSVVDFNNDNRYVWNTDKTITEEGVKNSSTKILPKGALILSARGTVGALAQLAVPMAFNQSCYGIIAKEQTTNDFLYYLLKTVVTDLQSKGHGSVFNTITRDTFDTIEISLPPLEEQKRIADILGAFDDKIELLQKQNKTLEDMAKAIFKSWFVDFDVVKAKAALATRKGSPTKTLGDDALSTKADIMREYHLTEELYDLFPSSFEDSSLGPIPSGWKVGKLANLTNILGGFAFKSQEFTSIGTPVIKIKNIQSDHSVNLDDVQYVADELREKNKKFILVDGDIVMAMTGATIGKFAIIVNKHGKTSLLNQRVAKISAKDSSCCWFVYFALLQYNVEEQVKNNGLGSAQSNISTEGIGNSIIVEPIPQIQKEFSRIVKLYMDKILCNKKQIQTLTELRDSLLPRLISGKIKI